MVPRVLSPCSTLINIMYVSIDLETTGLCPVTCQIIEVGAIKSNDLDNPFHCYVIHDRYVGEPFALSMHGRIFKRIAVKERGYKYLTPREVVFHLWDWLGDKPVTAAGKNFNSFDLPFLRQLPDWRPFFKHRVIDPGNLYWEPELDGDRLPDMPTCMARAGMTGVVGHTALEDAEIVLELVERWKRRG